MSITVYSKPACNQCDATKRAFDRAGLEFSVIDMTQDSDAFEKVKASGALAAPFVEVEFEDGSTKSWAGFQPEEILSLV